MTNVFKKAALAVAIAGAGFAASATPIIGIANMSFGNVSITNGEIDWNPPLNPGFNASATYGGFFTSGGSNTGSFAAGPFAGVTAGLVQDMSSNPADGSFVPVGPGLTNNFLQFAAQPGWQFTANFLVPGNPLPFTPFNLTQSGQNVSATISLNGIACDTGGDNICDLNDDKTKWTAIFSAQFTNTTVGQLILDIVTNNQEANNTWSGTLEATKIPEPGSLALLGLGLVGLAAMRRKSVK